MLPVRVRGREVRGPEALLERDALADLLQQEFLLGLRLAPLVAEHPDGSHGVLGTAALAPRLVDRRCGDAGRGQGEDGGQDSRELHFRRFLFSFSAFFSFLLVVKEWIGQET